MQRKTLFRALSCVLAIVLLLGCSFAYFTDYATTQANGTAGTVALSLDSNINLLDANGQDIINPGDMRDGSFTVTNEGNKSIDVRTTIVLTTQSNTGFDLAFGGDGSTQSEYDLYLRDDVELVDGYGYMPKADAQPLQVKSIDQDVITYILPEYTLNGNSDRYDEVETVDGVTEFSHNYDLVMVMKGGATNEWQNSSVQIDVLVEAKQHENTQSGWEIVAQENVTSGAIEKDVVKGEGSLTNVIGEDIKGSLADYSWSEIATLSARGVDLNEYNIEVGDVKDGYIYSGIDANYGGMVFLGRTNETKAWNTTGYNDGGYSGLYWDNETVKNSTVKDTAEAIYENMEDSELKSAIKLSEVVSNWKWSNSDVGTQTNELHIFVPSDDEFTSWEYFQVDGQAKRAALADGIGFWTRTAHYYHYTTVYAYNDAGNSESTGIATTDATGLLVVYAFVI